MRVRVIIVGAQKTLVKESRTIEIRNRRFREDDVLALATIFSEQARLAKKGNHSFSISFVLRCTDGIMYESEDPDVFAGDGACGVKPPKAIEMSFADYASGRRLTLTAVHGGEYSDRFVVSGDDPKWVHDVFLTVQERLQALPPTDVWFTRHPELTSVLGMLGLGSIGQLLISTVISFIVPSFFATWKPSPETVAWVRDSVLLRVLVHPIVQIPVAWVARWLFGGAPWFYFERWLLEAYPSIELDFGPEHLKLASNRRKRIGQFFVFVVAPLGAAILYDIVKTLLM
jgi:hypothetical protein